MEKFGFLEKQRPALDTWLAHEMGEKAAFLYPIILRNDP
ncbi:hypothetical protein AmDm5_0684 [Acetobacter malorum]|nr:hypothetical protein AmDm5_0684 [Acetobacter malorum]